MANQMTAKEAFLRAAAKMEDSLATTLNTVSANATPQELERILKLIIKKEMVLEFLLEEFPIDNNNRIPLVPIREQAKSKQQKKKDDVKKSKGELENQ